MMENSRGSKRGRVSKECHGVNMLSELPDSLICSIISNLPFDEAVATSLLCRRWRSLWQWVSRIEFDISHIKPWISDGSEEWKDCHEALISDESSIMAKIDATMMSSLQNRNLSVCRIVHVRETGLFKFLAKQNQLEEISLVCLNCPSRSGWQMKIPQCAFQSNYKLSVLKLTNYIFQDESPKFDEVFVNLKTLALTNVVFSFDVHIHEILHSCPKLENLALESCHVRKLNSLVHSNDGSLKFLALELNTLSMLMSFMNLKTLSLTNVVLAINFRIGDEILYSCPNLEHLALRSCHNQKVYPNKKSPSKRSFKLTTLTLDRYEVRDAISTFRGCVNLNNLKLKDVVFRDGDVTLGNIFKCCPRLENLTLDSCHPTHAGSSVEDFIIQSVNLKSLKINNMEVQTTPDDHEQDDNPNDVHSSKKMFRISIKCPCLKDLSLYYCEHEQMRCILKESSGGLAKEISNEIPIMDLRVLRTTLDLNSIMDIIVLANILDAWANLQEIDITNKEDSGEDVNDLQFWEQKKLPRCISYQLRVVIIRGFRGKLQEIMFIVFLLKSAARLKSLVIEFDDDCSKNGAVTTLTLISTVRSRALKPGIEYLQKFGGNLQDWMSTLK